MFARHCWRCTRVWLRTLARLDVVSPAHRFIVELIYKLVPRPSGERLDGGTLPLVAVLVGPDIRGGAGP
jgi:hypothetical protein